MVNQMIQMPKTILIDFQELPDVHRHKPSTVRDLWHWLFPITISCDGRCRTNIHGRAQRSIISFPSNNIELFWGFCYHRTLCNLAHALWTCPKKPPSIGPIALSCHDSACPSAEGAVSGKMAGLGRWVWKCLESPVIWHSRVLCEIGTYLFESCLYPWTSFWTGKKKHGSLWICATFDACGSSWIIAFACWLG